MTSNRLTGRDAIEHARLHGLTLSKYQDPTDGSRDGLGVEDAEEIAREDPSLIYLDVDDGVQWWRVARPNGTPSYGYGTREQADAWADRMSDERGLDVDRYAVSAADDYDESSRNDGVDIGEELAEAEA